MANDNPRARLAELRERWDADRTSRLFLQLAEEYRRQGMPHDALGVLEEGLKVHPPTGAAQVVLGRCQLDAGSIPAALDTLEQVVLRDPTQMVAYRALVDGYIQKRDASKAKERLGLYAQLNPQDPEIEDLSERIQRLDVALEPEEPEVSSDIPASGISVEKSAADEAEQTRLDTAVLPPLAVSPSLERLADLDPGATIQIPSLSSDEAAALASSPRSLDEGVAADSFASHHSDDASDLLSTESVDLPTEFDLESSELTPTIPDIPDIPGIPDIPDIPDPPALSLDLEERADSWKEPPELQGMGAVPMEADEVARDNRASSRSRSPRPPA